MRVRNSSHPGGTLIGVVAGVAAQGLKTQFAKVLEREPHDRSFLVRSGGGWREGIAGHARIGDDLKSPAGYAFRASRPVISNHLGSETRFRVPRLLSEHGIHSAINVIVRASDDGAQFPERHRTPGARRGGQPDHDDRRRS